MLRQARWWPCNVLPPRMTRVAPTWSGSITSAHRWSCPGCQGQRRGGWRCWCTAEVWWSSTLLWATREITPVLWGKVQFTTKNTTLRILAASLKPFHEWFDRNASGESWFRLTVDPAQSEQYDETCHVQTPCDLTCPDVHTPAESTYITISHTVWHKVCRCSRGAGREPATGSLTRLRKSCFLLSGRRAVANERPQPRERGEGQRGCLHLHQILSLSWSVMSHDLHRAARCKTKWCAYTFTEVHLLS